MLNVLLIDDDEKLAQLLCEYCRMYDIAIQSVTLPSTGLQRLQQESFDAVILDVMLPEMDGFEVCKQTRQFSEIPIIMLTARGEVTDRVVGLEIGADDYMPKPFEPRELVARINTIVKRKQPAPIKSAALEFDRLIINTQQRTVTVANKLTELTTMEYQLLLMLASNPGQDFSRDDILNHLKGTETELFSRSVDILISRLRSKLKPLSPIKTVYGAGYAFIGESV
ncbi:DNA-binding response regulator [Chromatiales bacterium (ex Bugula neritina AB1)]|nr:DNA-binding response regulator [Chromatiales bacterium (ex Bugula neritina AB1)]